MQTFLSLTANVTIGLAPGQLQWGKKKAGAMGIFWSGESHKSAKKDP
jgi:hypothetical protein